MEKLFDKPMTMFQKNVNDIMKDNKSVNLIEDLIRLNMFKNAEKDERQLILVELYNLLGIEKFMEVMDLMSGKSIKFPNKLDFKETVQTAICYYYRQYKDSSWEVIKELLNDEELSTAKINNKIMQLQNFIDKFGELRWRRMQNGK